MNSKEITLAVISLTLLILLLIAVVAIVFFIAVRQRARQELELAKVKLDFEKEIRQIEIEVSENILGHFSHELHDNVGQLLTAAHIQLENQKLDHPMLAEGLKPIEIYLKEATDQLRLISRTFNKDYLGHIGLLNAIQLETDRLKSLRRFNVHWQIPEKCLELSKNDELVIFRILQEIIQNALRHSSAQNFTVSINKQNNKFVFQAHDDGKGFLLNEILSSNKASGLLNILKRAELINMECTIRAEPGKGCVYVLSSRT